MEPPDRSIITQPELVLYYNDFGKSSADNCLAMKVSDRSMADFASATGVSTSMLSRIVNGNYSKPISIDILQKIASCVAKECPLDLEDLLEANGMMTKEEASHVSAMERRRQRMIEQQKRRREMRDIITDELFARGIAIKKLGVPDKSEVHHSKLFSGARVCDMAITLPDQEYMEWGFSMLSVIRDSDDTERDDAFYIRRIIDNYAVIFLQDAWEPENSKHNKFSFCFADETYFNMFVDALQVAKFHNRMSAILIDVNTRKVIKEYNFPCENFPETESLFDTPVHQEEDHGKGDFRQMTFLGDFLNGEDSE